MKTLLKFFALILLLCISSCGTGDFQNLTKAVQEISKLYGTQNVTVSTTTMVSNTKNMDAYTVQIADVKGIDEQKIHPLIVASHSAKIVYDNITPEQRTEHKTINVNITSKSQSQGYSFNIADIKRVDRFIRPGLAAVNKIKAKDYNGFYGYFDPKYVSRQDLDEKLIKPIINKNEKIFAHLGKPKIAGFNFSEKDAIKVVEIFLTVPSDTLDIHYSITFKDTTKPKIVGFWIN